MEEVKHDKCVGPEKITITGIDGYETYVIDSITIGIRPKWISVKDRLPKIGMNFIYLFFNGKREVTLGYAFDVEDTTRVWINDFDRQTNEIATHWMPLPKPPEI